MQLNPDALCFADWLLSTPFALGGVLSYVGERYDKPETWVTEFGTGITGENAWQGDQVCMWHLGFSFPGHAAKQ